MTPDEIVTLAERMRAAGVVRFSVNGDRISVVLRPPDPKPLDEIRDRIAELPPDERMKLSKQAQKDLEADLYGAAR